MACTLTDLSGFSGGDAPTPPPITPDATTDGGGPVDAARDAVTPVFPDEVGTDAGPAFCATSGAGAAFCEDFDGAGTLEKFGRVDTSGGTLVVDGASFTSAARSLVATGPSAATPTGAYADVFTDGVPRSRVQLSAAVRLEALNTTTTSATQIMKIWFFGTNNAYEVAMSVLGLSGKLVVFEYTSKTGVYKELAELDALPLNTWTRFTIEARIGAAGNVAFVDRDGVRVVDGAVLTPPYASGTVECALGLPYMDANHGEWKVRLDDILVKLP